MVAERKTRRTCKIIFNLRIVSYDISANIHFYNYICAGDVKKGYEFFGKNIGRDKGRYDQYYCEKDKYGLFGGFQGVMSLKVLVNCRILQL